jgi:hypothetical protein
VKEQVLGLGASIRQCQDRAVLKQCSLELKELQSIIEAKIRTCSDREEDEITEDSDSEIPSEHSPAI